MRRILATGSQRGFTLLELMVVLVIIALASAAVPLILNHSLPSRRLDATLERLATTVRDAQGLSIAQGHALQLSLSQYGLALEGDSKPLGGRAATWSSSTHVEMRTESGALSTSLRVYPDGSLDATRIQVSDSGRSGEIRLSALTGRISVKRIL